MKKLLAIVISMAMIVAMMPMGVFAGEGESGTSTSGSTVEDKMNSVEVSADNDVTTDDSGKLILSDVAKIGETGYSGAELPAGPDMSGTVVNVNTVNAQYTLDGAYGSIDGKTINFTQNVDTVLHIGRPTKFAESNTEYYVGGYVENAKYYKRFNTAEELVAYKNEEGWTPGCFYSRTVSNVKFTSNKDVTLAGFDMNNATGQVYQIDGQEGPYDFVRDRQIVNGTNDGYYGHININGLTFDGLTIENNDAYAIQFDITSVSNKQNILKGITFKI